MNQFGVYCRCGVPAGSTEDAVVGTELACEVPSGRSGNDGVLNSCTIAFDIVKGSTLAELNCIDNASTHSVIEPFQATSSI